MSGADWNHHSNIAPVQSSMSVRAATRSPPEGTRSTPVSIIIGAGSSRRSASLSSISTPPFPFHHPGRLPVSQNALYILSGVVDWLEDHPWDVRRHPLPSSVAVEDAAIPMRDGVELTATVFRDRAAPPRSR